MTEAIKYVSKSVVNTAFHFSLNSRGSVTLILKYKKEEEKTLRDDHCYYKNVSLACFCSLKSTLMRLLMCGSLKKHYDVTALSEHHAESLLTTKDTIRKSLLQSILRIT